MQRLNNIFEIKMIIMHLCGIKPSCKFNVNDRLRTPHNIYFLQPADNAEFINNGQVIKD